MLKRIISFFIIMGFFSGTYAAGDCSPYLGLATLNEFFKDKTNQANDIDDYVEVKLLDTSIPFSVFSQWSIQVCENGGDGCSIDDYVIHLSNFTDTQIPWLVLKDEAIGTYINFKTGFDAILLDANDDVIDYLSVDGYSPQEAPACTGASLPYDYQATAPGASDKFIFRSPDGTGDWDDATSAAEDPTEGGSNDDDPADPAPNLTFSDITITQGTTTATITLTLNPASTDPVTVNFYTIDGTLFNGTDYTAVNTSGTFAAGDTNLTFNVPVSATSNLGNFNFFISIDAASTGTAIIASHNGSITVVGLPPDHYAIAHSGPGVTCEAESITVTAHNASHGVTAPSSSTTITLSTSIANDGWALQSGNGTFTAPDQYTFDGSETSVQFWLTKTSATAAPHMDIDVTDGTSADPDDGGLEDEVLEYRDTALRFYADNIYNNIGTQVAGKSSDAVSGIQTLTLKAVQTNTDTGACEARITGDQTVQMAFECLNPTTCKTNNGVSITDTTPGVATPIDDNPSGSVSSFTDVDLRFDSSGTATWVMNYLDAGQIALHASLTIAASGDDPVDTLAGTSNSFAIVPAGLCVSSPDGNASCASADVSCSPFKRAGEIFNLSVRAVAWESAFDTDFCSGNATTPNFQLAGISIGHNPVGPATSFSGLLGVNSMDINAADDGDGNIASQTVSEVGVFTFVAAPPVYFGETIMASTSTNIGRFYPDHFSLTSNPVTNRIALGGGGVFSYMDEDFQLSYTLTAENTTNGVTRNYSTASGFARLDTAARLNYAAVDTTLPISLTGRLTVVTPSIDWIAGTLDMTDTANISRDTNSDGPFNFMDVGIAPEDEDGVLLASYDLDVDADSTDDHTIVGTTQIRFGRMALSNTFGSELVTLNMPMVAEYFDGVSFIANGDDSLTPLGTTELILSNLVEGGQTDGDIQVLAGQASQASIANNPLLLGNAGLSFCPPGNPACTPTSGNEGYINVQLDLTLYPYLQFDWDGDGNHDNDPTARATFGIYSGDSKQIYYRQIYQ